MKKIIPLILILFVFFLQFKAASFLHLFSLPNALGDQERPIDWKKDFATAWGQAVKEKKQLFLYFEKKNSPWCLKMQKEILEDRGFIQEMQDLFLFVRLDIEEAEKESFFFRVKEAPMVVFLDLQKERIGRISYLPFTGRKYAGEIKKVFAHDSDFGSAFKEMKKQDWSRYFSQNAWGEGDKSGPFFYSGRFFPSLLNQYDELLQQNELDASSVLEKRKEIENLDPHNFLGLRQHLAFLDFYFLSKTSSPEMAIAPLVHYIDQFGKREKENLWQLQMTIAQFLFAKGSGDKALCFAREAYRFAPTAIKKELGQSVRYIKECLGPIQESSRK